jgi:ankyrin repeat protein
MKAQFLRALASHDAMMLSSYLLNNLIETPEKLEKLVRALASGFDPNAKDQTGCSLTMRAAFEGNERLLRLLIDHGADPNAVDQGGAGAAHRAAERGHVACLELLAERGADLNALDRAGRSPSSRAAIQGCIGALESLASLGVDLRARAPDGRSLAFDAIVWGGPETLTFLRSRGVDLHAPDNEGETPLELARRVGRFESADFLDSDLCQRALEAAAPSAPDASPFNRPRL